MLAELKAAHTEILTVLDDLEGLVGGVVPQMNALATARLSLTRASRRRTTLLEMTIYSRLLCDAAPTDQLRVQTLREGGKRQQIASADHIGRWTPSEIEAHWRDYCLASRTMRAAMRIRVQEEQHVLYPLLESLA